MRRRIPPTMQRKQTDPVFFHFKLYNKDLSLSHLYRKFQEKLLDHELKQKRIQQRILSRKLKFLKSDLQSTFSHFDFLHLSHLIENCNRKKNNRVIMIIMTEKYSSILDFEQLIWSTNLIQIKSSIISPANT